MLEQIDKMILESTPVGSTPVLQSDLLFIIYFLFLKRNVVYARMQ